MIERWGAFVARRAATVLATGLIATVLAGLYGFGVFDHLSQGGFDDPDSESVAQVTAERELFGNQGVDVVVIYSSDTLTADDAEFRAEVEQTVAGYPADAVARVVTPYDAPEEQAEGLITPARDAVQVHLSLAGDGQNAFLDSYNDVKPALEAETLTTDIAGTYAVYDDVNDITGEDLKRAELISMPLVLILALLIFGSLVAASMPVLVGLTATVGALAVVRLLTVFTDVSVFAVNVVSLLGIGLAIDYALFIISRFREELAKLPADHPDASAVAIQRTMSTAGRTVLFSGLTVAGALLSLIIFPQNFLRSMGLGGMAAVTVAMIAALTILPAALKLLGRRVDAGRLPWRRHAAVATESDHGAWARLARGVMRRPVWVMVGTTVLLLAIAAPFLGVKWGSVDYRVLPDDAPGHVAAVKLQDFGPETSTANILVRGIDESQLPAYVDELAEVDGVMAVQPVVSEGDANLYRAVWEGNSQTEESQQIVRDLRAVEPPQGEVLIGGLSADTVDLLDSIGAHLPWMGLIVVVVMFALLFMAFGSLVLPVKAIVMNGLSITASFGVVTWIFSDGNLADLLGFTPQGFLDATNPILMLAIVFGLSMDYEVFLLSRVREQWDLTGDNDIAVATGVQKTGRIITSAALLLGVVIGAFGTSGIVFMKMLGIGMLVALLLDATVVRALLVPATMKLLGRWNWWAPAPMQRWWERYGFREEGRPVAGEPTPVGVTAGSS